MSPEGPTTQFFADATNTTVNDGVFAAVGRDMHVNVHSPSAERYGLKLLLNNIAPDAFHNAAEPGDTPRCHPDTRVALRSQIMEWIKAPESLRKIIIWLNGPAGAGKTAIGHSIAEQCEEEGLLAASFFFSRGAAGRNNTSKLIATLAYQLSRSIPQMREPLLAAIEEDPTIFSRALSVQMRTLVILPLTSVQVPLPSLPRVVVMDGVDECGPNRESQAELLHVVGDAITELFSHHFPIIFLIGSRPEYEIRYAFNQEPLISLMRGISLDNDYRADDDIKLYLASKFQEVRRKQLALGTHLDSSWPAETDVNRLVEKSSGQFIFAATVIKFIDSPRRDPVDRLEIVLGLSDAGNETPFAALDTLYRHILSEVDDLPKVLKVLTLLMLNTDSRVSVLAPSAGSKFLCFEVRRALMDMHALVFVPPPNDSHSFIRIHHASMSDFLMDRSRSREFFIDAKQGHVFLSQRWLGAIENYPHSLDTADGNVVSLRECISNFYFHLKISPVSTETAEKLAAIDLGALLARLPDHYDLYRTFWSDLFKCAMHCQQQGIGPDICRRFHKEFYSFFFDRLVQYPPSLQAYIPALICHHNLDSRQLFSMLLSSKDKSNAKLKVLHKLDKGLLKIENTHMRPEQKISHCDARTWFITRLIWLEADLQYSHAILADQIVKPESRRLLGENLPTELHHDIPEDTKDGVAYCGFEDIQKFSIKDLENMAHKRQAKRDGEGKTGRDASVVEIVKIRDDDPSHPSPHSKSLSTPESILPVSRLEDMPPGPSTSSRYSTDSVVEDIPSHDTSSPSFSHSESNPQPNSISPSLHFGDAPDNLSQSSHGHGLSHDSLIESSVVEHDESITRTPSLLESSLPTSSQMYASDQPEETEVIDVQTPSSLLNSTLPLSQGIYLNLKYFSLLVIFFLCYCIYQLLLF